MEDTTPQPEGFAIPNEYVQDGKILGQYDNVNQMLDALAGGETAPSPAAAPEVAPEAPVEPLKELQIDSPVAETPGNLEQAQLLELFQEAQQNNGSLTDESYKSLAGKGLSRDVVDMTLRGIEAQRAAAAREIADAVGGEAKIHQAFDWAKANLSEAERTEINSQLNASSPTVQAALIRDLITRSGVSEQRGAIQGQSGRNMGPAPFTSSDQLQEAIRNPQYRTNEAYRAEVMERAKGLL